MSEDVKLPKIEVSAELLRNSPESLLDLLHARGISGSAYLIRGYDASDHASQNLKAIYAMPVSELEEMDRLKREGGPLGAFFAIGNDPIAYALQDRNDNSSPTISVYDARLYVQSVDEGGSYFYACSGIPSVDGGKVLELTLTGD